ncbi:MAG: flagellar basal body L-ring protein FlgH, partial [Rhizobiales bacterium]|nr:flagellar basal body L-ring protein FlgH [Hyphomicrobiales bacterium]
MGFHHDPVFRRILGDLTQFFGVDLTGFFNDSITPSSLASLGSTSTLDGTGSVNRTESVTLTVGAVITQVLPNGLLVLNGRQEVRVNNEVRELLVSGLIRPEDITSGNTINHTQIAEARISYGGRGHLSDMQRPRYGQEL